jgi:transcriptional regulator with XRE-family HTH domain/predicted XRE-type DNA-binding protein
MAGSRAILAEEERRLIGRRIRRRRLFLKQSQAGLARALGVTYQLLQKYEAGVNRVPKSRLDQIASLLEVTPDYFSLESASVAVQDADALDGFLQSREAIDFNRVVAGLPDAARARLIMAVGFYCDSLSRPETPDIAGLTQWLRKLSDRSGSAGIAGDAQDALHATKVELARLLGRTLRARRMTQSFAGQILLTNQARISTLARGDVRGVSLDKLLRYFVLLGWDLRIGIVRRPGDRPGMLQIAVRDA